MFIAYVALPFKRRLSTQNAKPHELIGGAFLHSILLLCYCPKP